jgi:hypothetical protein
MIKERRKPNLVTDIWREALRQEDYFVTGCTEGVRNRAAPETFVDEES